MKKILILAGEESGVLYANGLAGKLAGIPGGCEVRGYSDYGFDTADLAVIGIWAVVRRLFYFLRVRRTMRRAIREWRPDAVCTIDYPGMNLPLARYAKSLGIRAVHVVCPQVWAWKKGRIPKIEKSLDRLCCFFPFEPALFKPGFAVFTGHPLADAIDGARRPAGAEGTARLVALLPGSRMGEIEHNFPVMLEAASEITTRFGDGVRFAIPAASPRALSKIDGILRGFRPRAGMAAPKAEARLGGARELLFSADCAAVASGTATLEAALAGCPTILVYRAGAVLAWLARRFVKGVRHLGLANIIWEKSGCAGEEPMREILQEEFTPGALAEALGGFVADASAREAASRRLGEVCSSRRAAGRGGDALDAVAKEVLGI